MEYVTPERRATASNVSLGLGYVIGAAGSPWVMKLAGGWKEFHYVWICPISVLILASPL